MRHRAAAPRRSPPPPPPRRFAVAASAAALLSLSCALCRILAAHAAMPPMPRRRRCHLADTAAGAASRFWRLSRIAHSAPFASPAAVVVVAPTRALRSSRNRRRARCLALVRGFAVLLPPQSSRTRASPLRLHRLDYSFRAPPPPLLARAGRSLVREHSSAEPLLAATNGAAPLRRRCLSAYLARLKVLGLA
ncbi:hypothetical protein Scep_029783 [Stephania cephalantha]|uniref:Uncharacterized protein n=1 Tax=Stephania cephalantha TaxID=152367 RepID=A0AAP0E2V8_9MAGN